MARLHQALLHKVAKKLRKTPQYIREQVSRRASREAVSSDVALIMWARDLGIGVASALSRVPVGAQQQLSVARASPPPARRRARRSTHPRGRARRPTPLVFVSHSSQDRELARAVVELLREALTLRPDQVVCTSVDGYRLPAGADTDEALRAAVLGSRALVGLVTPASGRSAYVQAELGARWGARKHLAPVTAGGGRPGDVRGPVGQLNALDLTVRNSVLQLVSDLGTELGREPEAAHVFADAVDAVVRLARRRAKSKKRPKRKKKR